MNPKWIPFYRFNIYFLAFTIWKNPNIQSGTIWGQKPCSCPWRLASLEPEEDVKQRLELESCPLWRITRQKKQFFGDNTLQECWCPFGCHVSIAARLKLQRMGGLTNWSQNRGSLLRFSWKAPAVTPPSSCVHACIDLCCSLRPLVTREADTLSVWSVSAALCEHLADTQRLQKSPQKTPHCW